MRKTEERPRVSPGFDRKTLAWVAGAHLLILLVLALVSFSQRSKPPEKMLEMVDLGSANPGAGSAAGSEKSATQVTNPNLAKNSDGAPPPLPPIKQPTPPSPVPVQEVKKIEPVKDEVKPDPVPVKPVPVVKKTEPVPEKVEKVEKIEKVKPEVKEPREKPSEVKNTKPKEELKKPVKAPIKIDLTKVKRTVAESSSPSSTETGSVSGKESGKKNGVREGVANSNGSNPEAKGPSASDIKGALSKGLQSVGVVDGSGSGPKGSPDGDAYNGLIKKTLTGNWVKPGSSAADLKTLVRIRIKPDGSVELIGLSQSSGDKAMDQSVLDAVRSTGKLSKALPEGLGSPDYEVVVNFQLE